MAERPTSRRSKRATRQARRKQRKAAAQARRKQKRARKQQLREQRAKERRTLWEANDVYFKVSPFMHADKINEPILLIHGEAANNSGTFPCSPSGCTRRSRATVAPCDLSCCPTSLMAIELGSPSCIRKPK